MAAGRGRAARFPVGVRWVGGQRTQSGLWYRQATDCGVSIGAPASMDQASRMYCACVQASGRGGERGLTRLEGRSAAGWWLVIPHLLGKQQTLVVGGPGHGVEVVLRR